MSNSMFDVIQDDLNLLNEGLLKAIASPVELVNEVGTHLVTDGGKRIREDYGVHVESLARIKSMSFE